jgi:hypothetical protein
MKARAFRRFLAGSSLALASLIAASAAAGVPGTITHQGRLYDASEKPIQGALSVQVAIYADKTSAVPLWSEVNTVTFDEGYFSIQLGAGVPFGAGVFDGSTRYLGITVGSDPEMTPRPPVASVPYALLASDVNGDIHPTSVSINGVGTVINSGGKWVGDPAGLQGPQGPQGPQGLQGPQGASGPVGPTGSTGPAGATGATGALGALGPTGATGPQGPQGVAGPAGPAGAAGPQGVQGAIGATGPAGATGTPGAVGATGPVGPQGVQGAAGAAGAAGPQGPIGLVGATGPAGATGGVGPTGPGGAVGATGAVGAPGPAGATGSQGLQGVAGPAGVQGPAGAAGPTGPAGPAGVAGALGATGPQGAGGVAGALGPTGPAGAVGATGPTSVPVCPAPYTTVNLTLNTGVTQRSTLCVYRDTALNDWDTGAYFCGFTYGGKLCTHEQIRRACSLGGMSLATGTWLADRVGDSSALFVNNTTCNDFDGVATSQNGPGSPLTNASYCCLEWMKYP